MKSYAETTKIAAKKIELIIESRKNVNISYLYYAIMNTFGLGQNFINKHLDVLEGVGLVTISDNMVSWVEVKK